jgi:hypothetical protein
MKKVFFIAFFLCIWYGSQAQTTLQIGVKAGSNYSTVAGDVATYTNSKDSDRIYLQRDKVEGILGVHAGVFAIKPLSERFSLRAEILYAGKGYIFTQTRETVEMFGDKVEEEYRFRSHYIDVPLLAQLKAGNFYLEAGPALSFLIAAQEDLKQTYTSPEWPEQTTEERHDRTSSTKGTSKVNLGYAVGAGYELPNGMGIGLRYSSDLSSIAKNKYNGQPVKARNTMVHLSLSYVFRGR